MTLRQKREDDDGDQAQVELPVERLVGFAGSFEVLKKLNPEQSIVDFWIASYGGEKVEHRGARG